MKPFSLLLGLGLLLNTVARGQGPLTPPGPPAPTMKTLEQIEPRALIGQLPYVISRPGAYYLTNDLVAGVDGGGIQINAGDVTLDLNGYSLRGASGLGTAIVAGTGAGNLAIRNGTIRGWNAAMAATNAGGSQFEGLRILNNAGQGMAVGRNCRIRNCGFETNGVFGLSAGPGAIVNGCASAGNDGDGFRVGDGAVVTQCSALGNSGQGIDAGVGSSISACVAESNGGYGFYLSSGTTIKECAAASNSNVGFSVGPASVVADCTAYYNGNVGIYTGAHCLIKGCAVYFGDSDGVQVDDGCVVLENICNENGMPNVTAAGIYVTGSGNRIEANQLFGNYGQGLLVSTNKNVIIKNTAKGNTVRNYDISAGNDAGPIGAAATVTSPWANIAF